MQQDIGYVLIHRGLQGKANQHLDRDKSGQLIQQDGEAPRDTLILLEYNTMIERLVDKSKRKESKS